MATQRICAIYNNTDYPLYLWTSSNKVATPLNPRQGRPHVEITIPRYNLDLDACAYVALSSKDHSKAPMPEDGLLLWAAKLDGEIGITFADGKSKRGIYHMSFEKDIDNYFALFFELKKNDDGKDELDVVLELRASNGVKQWLLNLLKQRTVEHHDEMQQLRQEAGKAVLAML